MFRLMCILALCVGALGSQAERELHDRLKDIADQPCVRPVESDGDALPVSVELMLTDVGVDAAHHKADFSGWLYMSWNVSALAWDAEKEGVTDVRLNEDEMWTPDVLPYNMLPSNDWKVKMLALVKPDGQVHYVPMVRFTVRCQHKITDDSERLVCPVKLGSWTYSGAQLDIQAGRSDIDLENFHANGDWAVESSEVTREAKEYDCCPGEEYPSLTAELVLKPQRS